ncbi:MAG: phosphoribosylaminoimidazolesuccinocarboxamide synthase [Phycisphaeraceae bacterium]|nr:phosphoribosylaminoimidazolesuccinocarboxamide synthase [Phycisphaeraceae bacterium]
MTADLAPLHTTSLAMPPLRQGKVRDVFPLPGDDNALLIVATDRISAFDVVMPTPIPGKGRVLTALSTFWLQWIEARGFCRTHLISADASTLPDSLFIPGGTTREQLHGRIMIARRAGVVPIECVARGYIEGSGWKDYLATGAICGNPLPPGLRQCQRLPHPIFTPATKEELGLHDQNIDFDAAAQRVGRPLMARLKDLTLSIYNAAAEYALSRGIIIADTKFEFGLLPGDPNPILIDEALTPDSSRFWPADQHQPGKAQPSFDKQFLREYLETLVAKGQWNKQSPGPSLPPEIVAATLERYTQACAKLAGQAL